MPTGRADDTSQAAPPAAEATSGARTGRDSPPISPRSTCATTKAMNRAGSQRPSRGSRTGRLRLTGAGKGSPSMIFTSTAVASSMPPA